jgi:hypothetical protein
MRFLHRIRVQRAIALAGLLLLAGCGRSLLVSAPVANDAPGTLAAAVQAPQPPSLLGGALPIIDKILSWVPVVQTLVRKDQVATVSGHRWSLAFDKGSLTDDTVITIDDYDANVLDVQFGPHGTKFPVPVTLTVDFSNTAADPGAVQFDGSEPVLYWLNDRTNAWEEVPGRVDWAHRQLIVKLPHFSRYVVGGKAGWKHDPQHQDE